MTNGRPAQPIIGEAPAFLEMLEHVSRAAPLNKPLLVVGERGTGKELIASRLHYLSNRWEQPLVKVTSKRQNAMRRCPTYEVCRRFESSVCAGIGDVDTDEHGDAECDSGDTQY